MFSGSQFSYSIFCTWFHAVNVWVTSEFFSEYFPLLELLRFSTNRFSVNIASQLRFIDLTTSVFYRLNWVLVSPWIESFWSYVSPFSVLGLFMLCIFRLHEFQRISLVLSSTWNYVHIFKIFLQKFYVPKFPTTSAFGTFDLPPSLFLNSSLVLDLGTFLPLFSTIEDHKTLKVSLHIFWPGFSFLDQKQTTSSLLLLRGFGYYC